MQRGKLYFSVGEESIIQGLMETYGITELEAVEHVIRQKRELAYIYSRRGNELLASQLRKEIGDE